MKRLLLIVAFMLTGLSGCYVVPYGTHGDGYRRDGDHHEDNDRHHDRDDHDSDRREEHGDRDGYR